MQRFLAHLLTVLMVAPAGFAGEVIKRGPNTDTLFGVTSSGTGNDDTLGYLTSLRKFEGLDTGQLRTQIWFDPYLGNDSTGTGTYLNPYRSFEKMKTACVAYTRCTVKGKGRVFSPLTLEMDTATTRAIGESFVIGETVSWNAGADTGTVLDVFEDGTNWFVVLARTGGTVDPNSTSTLAGTNPARSVDVDTVTNTIDVGAGNEADNDIVPDCSDLDRICILFESEYPEFPAYIDGNRFHTTNTAASPGGVFIVGDPTGGNGGWVGVQNFGCQNIANDCFSIAPTGGTTNHLVTLNTWARDVRNGSENRTDSTATNNCYTTHQNGAMVVINGGPSESRVTTNTGGCLAPTATSKLIVIGGEFRSEAIASGVTSALSLDNSDTAVVGATLLGGRHIPNNVISVGGSGQANRLQVARTLALNPTAGNFSNLSIGSLSQPWTIRLYETSLIQGNSTRVVTFTNATERVNLTAHGYPSLIGTFRFNTTGALPTGLSASTDYYICNVTANDFQVDDSSDCLSIVTFTDDGSGTNSIRVTRSFGEAVFVNSITGSNILDFQSLYTLIDNTDFWVETANSTNSVTGTLQFVMQGIYDDEDGATDSGFNASEFSWGGNDSATISVAETELAGFGAVGWSLFTSNSANSGAGTDGTSWTSDTATFRCDTSTPRECAEAAVTAPAYVIDLKTIYGSDPDDSCIPADVIGRRICALSLQPTHYGAR